MAALRRCVAEVTALPAGANPLLLMHLAAGIHNEALMFGLMLTGDRDRPAVSTIRKPAWHLALQLAAPSRADRSRCGAAGPGAGGHGADHVVLPA